MVRSSIRVLCALATGLAAAIFVTRDSAAEDPTVDTALVVSVDVSNSVDSDRYKLQMEGIAKALEDPGVIDAIVGGPNGGILFSMVTWADRPALVLPWTKVASKADAIALAQRVRKLPLQGGEFTCMTRMLRSANDKIVPQIPGKAGRIVIDVSGDGPDNCNADEPIEKVRDELVANGVTINGLPILDGANASRGVAGAVVPSAAKQQQDLISITNGIEDWYKTHVQGGAGSFVLPANGYGDFARAIRQKFVIEISGKMPPQKFGVVSVPRRLVEVQGGIKPDDGVEAAKLQ